MNALSVWLNNTMKNKENVIAHWWDSRGGATWTFKVLLKAFFSYMDEEENTKALQPGSKNKLPPPYLNLINKMHILQRLPLEKIN